MDKLSDTEAKNNSWRALYIAGGVAALLAVFVFRRNLGAELGLLSNFGIVRGVPTTPLSSALDWFNLLQENGWSVSLCLISLTLSNMPW